MRSHRTLAFAALLTALLLGCSSGQPPSIDAGAGNSSALSASSPVAAWTVDRCLAEGGLVLEGATWRCRIGENAYVIDREQSSASVAPTPETPSQDATPGDIAAFLQSRGILTEQYQAIAEPPMGQRGIAAVIHGELVLFFGYDTAQAASEDFASLKVEGTLADGSQIRWGSAPTYLYGGSIVVASFSTSPELNRSIEESLQ
jgi:hypothetical protein